VCRVHAQHQHAQRVRDLAALQRSLILHAMRFPAVRTVVYSTCSVFTQENEDVVRAVLAGRSSLLCGTPAARLCECVWYLLAHFLLASR
jgi:16S rRNA C967 or C1407 C5-methylase (RsmB/RsmF family)